MSNTYEQHNWKIESKTRFQTKHKIYKTQETIVTDRLWPEIETLNRVLNEILVLIRSLEGAD
jgi:hypothetical protein